MMNLYKFTRYYVFGWSLFKRKLTAGEKYAVTFHVEKDKDILGLMTMWVKGRIIGKNITTGNVSPERLPGIFTEDRDFKYAPGRYEFECVEDSEWWCFPYSANGNQLPVCSAIRLGPGESLTLPPGQRAVVVFGDALLDDEPIVQVPMAIQRDVESVLTAATQTYGFLIEGSK